MKKTVFALLFASILMLTGCSKQAEPAQSPFTLATLDALASASVFSETLEPLDGEIALMLYQLDEADITECAAMRSTGTTCEEAVVALCADAAAAARVSDALDGYVAEQIAANESYRPAEVPKLKNAYIEIRENTVLLVIATDVTAIDGAIG